MTFHEVDLPPNAPRRFSATARSVVGSRTGLIVLGLGATGVGLATNWTWLSAVGAAPFVLALLPCAAMCALGLCAPRTMGRKAPPSDGHEEIDPK